MSVFKGWIGEKRTALALALFLNRRHYFKFHNLIIPTHNGTSQIDHIVVSPFGVFIVETKNLSGLIYGSAYKANWTQVLYHHKYKLRNPLRQTYRQKKSLAQFLSIHEDYIHTIVYFNGDCSFRTSFPSNVINYGLTNYIKSFFHRSLSPQQVKEICAQLSHHKKTSPLTKADHIQSLNQRLSSNSICPNCGNALVLRIAKKGPSAGSYFLGCQNYPECRYSKSA